MFSGKLVASDAAQDDEFGLSAAISDNLIVVGAPLDDDAGSKTGSAYVFRSFDNGTSWTEVEKLVASDAAAGDEFGGSVAISGNLVVVGAYRDDDGDTSTGSAYVFRSVDDGVSWSEVDKLVANDGSSIDQFGFSVAISGNLIVVGANLDEDGGARAGSAYVFRSVDDGVSWTQVEKLVARDAAADDFFGWSVAISANLVVVGAPFDDDGGGSAGSAYVFRTVDDGISWSEVEKLVASDGAGSDNFGYRVAISGNLVVVGAPLDDDGGKNAGSVYVFRSVDDGVSWAEVVKMVADDTNTGDNFGHSVAISGNLIVIGAIQDDDAGSNAGSAYVFRSDDNGTSWAEVDKLVAIDAAAGDELGESVAISGNLIVVGARLDDDAGFSSGSAYVFKTLS